MKTDLSNILIFKTNIQTEVDKQRIQSTLDAHDTIQQWNVDLHDVDCVLRIVSDTLTPEQIIKVIQRNGFECAELE
jgi:hypothetical protein